MWYDNFQTQTFHGINHGHNQAMGQQKLNTINQELSRQSVSPFAASHHLPVVAYNRDSTVRCLPCQRTYKKRHGTSVTSVAALCASPHQASRCGLHRILSVSTLESITSCLFTQVNNNNKILSHRISFSFTKKYKILFIYIICLINWHILPPKPLP